MSKPIEAYLIEDTLKFITAVVQKLESENHNADPYIAGTVHGMKAVQKYMTEWDG